MGEKLLNEMGNAFQIGAVDGKKPQVGSPLPLLVVVTEAMFKPRSGHARSLNGDYQESKPLLTGF